jgi:hypothetical protein
VWSRQRKCPLSQRKSPPAPRLFPHARGDGNPLHFKHLRPDNDLVATAEAKIFGRELSHGLADTIVSVRAAAT